MTKRITIISITDLDCLRDDIECSAALYAFDCITTNERELNALIDKAKWLELNDRVVDFNSDDFLDEIRDEVATLNDEQATRIEAQEIELLSA